MEATNKMTMCRLCLFENERFFNIFEVDVWHGYMAAEVISDLFHFKVTDSDGYPHVVCETCLTKLTDFKVFKEQCQTSRVMYDNVFASKENIVDHHIQRDEFISIKTEPIDPLDKEEPSKLTQICIQQPANQTQVVQLATTLPQAGATTTNVIVTGSTTVPVSQATVVATPTTLVTSQAADPQKKSLALSREQILEAQGMFRNANRVTRPEKALILGFMHGSRDNPCPQLGNIMTIKLSENQENVQQPDNTYLTMMIETHFQMNYNTGEWKRIKKCRKLEEETPA